MAGGAAYTYDPAMNFGVLVTVIVLSVAGGYLVQIIFGTRVPPYCQPCGTQKLAKGCIKSFTLPALLGQLVMGIIIINCFPTDFMQYYPTDAATWLRQMAMAILMLIGGMELEFEGRGGVMLALTFLPMIFEVLGMGIAGMTIMAKYDMTLNFAITIGFVLAAVSPGVLIPILIKLKEQGLGMAKGIPYLIIGAASFDDIVCITGFMVAANFAYNDFELNPAAPGPIIGRCVMEVVIGLATGFVAGLCAIPMKKMSKYIKLVKSCVFVMGLVALHYIFHWFAGEFLCAIIYGLTIQKIWGRDHETGIPMHEVEMVWGVMTPLLFGTIGASLNFAILDKESLGPIIGCIFIACIFRTVSAYFCVYERQYSWKEKLYIALAWVPKGSVNAVVGGMALDHASKMPSCDDYTAEGFEVCGTTEVYRYGQYCLSAALISVIITAPLGAVFGVVLAPHLLDKETEEERAEREKVEKDFMGDEAFEKEKKQEQDRAATAGKSLGQDPKMMIARSASSRSHRSMREKGKKSTTSNDDEYKKAQIDKLNQNLKERKTSADKKGDYAKLDPSTNDRMVEKNPQSQESKPTDGQQIELQNLK